jgi:hypothetical protein
LLPDFLEPLGTREAGNRTRADFFLGAPETVPEPEGALEVEAGLGAKEEGTDGFEDP